MVKIKICGITNMDEIDYINKLKPDYVGFVFAESTRKISKEKALKLCSKLAKTIKSVGVFRNQTISEIVDILNTVNLDIIQLHGNEDTYYIRKLRQIINSDIEIWKAVSTTNIENLKKLKDEMYEYKNNKKRIIDKYLVDGVNPGSGQDYSLSNLYCIPKEVEFFLAGGITPNNVKDKINMINPFGIDVSSGVECIDEYGKRKKSYEKIKALIENIN